MSRNLRDRVADLLSGPRDMLFRMTASDKAISDVELKRRMYEKLQIENSQLKELLAQQECTQKQLEIMRKSLREIIRVLFKAGTPYENIYTLVAPGLDVNGQKRLDVAKCMIPEDVLWVSPGDNSEEPTAADGNEQLYCLELAKFGDSGAGIRQLNTTGKCYVDYRKRLHRRVLEELVSAGERSDASVVEKL